MRVLALLIVISLFPRAALASDLLIVLSQQVASVVDFRLSPATQTLGKGASFSINIQVEPNGQEIAGVQIFINFNPAHLQVQSVNPASAPLDIPLTSSYSNTAGTVDLARGTFGARPKTTFTLGAITFNTLSVDAVTNLTFSTQRPRDTAASFNGMNVTRSLFGSVITMGATPTPTPPSAAPIGGGSSNPNPTSTPTPTPTPFFIPIPIFTPTFTVTPSPRPTVTPTFTPSPTFTPTPSPTVIPSPTSMPTFTPTPTLTYTLTPTPVPTFTPTFTSTITPTSTPTSILAPSPTPSFTPTPRPTPTATATPLPLPEATPVPPSATEKAQPSFFPQGIIFAAIAVIVLALVAQFLVDIRRRR